MLWAQPCQPPTRIGPKRTWMWALIFRSHQIMNMEATAMYPTMTPTTIPITTKVGTSQGIPQAAVTA